MILQLGLLHHNGVGLLIGIAMHGKQRSKAKSGGTDKRTEKESALTAGEIAGRLGLLFAGVYGLGQGFQIWTEGAVFVHLEMLVLSFLCYVAGFTCLVLAALYKKRLQRAAGWAVAGLLLTATFARGYNHLSYMNPRYVTDTAAFNHYAAELTLKGANPYKASMAPAADRFGLDKKYYNHDVRGKMVGNFSQPAQSFLVYTPFVGAGVANIGWVNLGAHLLAVLLLFLMVPVWIRPLALCVFMFEPELIEFTVRGGPDICYLPLLIAAAYTFRDRRPLSGVLWGLACGIKMGPWLLAPFFLVALYHETSGRNVKERLMETLRFFGPAAAAFLVPNLPFLLSAPGAWFEGVFTPMSRQFAMYGSGLVNITTSAGAPLSGTTYTLLALGVCATLTTLYSLFYEKAAVMIWILPGVILWLSPRAEHAHFIYWAPAFVVALAWRLHERFAETPELGGGTDGDKSCRDGGKAETEEGGNEGKRKENGSGSETTGPLFSALVSRLRTRTGCVVLLGIPFVFFAAAALRAAASKQSLHGEVLAVQDNREIGFAETIKVHVENRTNRKTTPRFAVFWRGNNLYFPEVEGGLKSLAPGAGRVFNLRAVGHMEAPPLEEPFRIRVYDGSGSRFYLTPPSGPEPRTALVYNRRLEHWDEARGSPVRWERTPVIRAAPDAVVRREHLGRNATCLETVQAGASEWSETALAQEIPPDAQTLKFVYASSANPVGGYEPLQLPGLEIEFPRGETAVFSPSSETVFPLAYRKNHRLNVELPYVNPRRWEDFMVDVLSLARYFGYAYTPGLTVRLTVGRHRKLPGKAGICISEISASHSKHLAAFSVETLPPLDNAGLEQWTRSGDRPLGWGVEPPAENVDFRVGLDGPGGVSLELYDKPRSKRRPGPRSEWKRLAVSQRLMKSVSRIDLLVCSSKTTNDVRAPDCLAGIKISDGSTRKVWTITDERSERTPDEVIQKADEGRMHIFSVPAEPGLGCARMSVKPGRLGRPGNKVSLLLHVHDSRSGDSEVRFSPLELHR